MTDLCVDAVHLAKWVADRGRWVGVHRSDERTFISVGCLICVCAAPANIHDVETRLHSAVNWNRLKVRLQRRARVFFFLSNKQALLVAVWKVKQVLHGHKGVAESFCGGDPLLGIDQQHLLQQAHKLPTVGLLREQVTTFQIHHQVHLQDILPSVLHAHLSVTVGTY